MTRPLYKRQCLSPGALLPSSGDWRPAVLLLRILLVLAVSSVFPSSRKQSKAQTTVPATGNTYRLQSGQLLQVQTARGEKQELILDLKSGEYAYVVFTWQGIDLHVLPLDPSGKNILPGSLPVLAPGPVSISIEAKETGTYKLEVTTPTDQKASGTYGANLETRLPTATDRIRCAAQNLTAEGWNKNSAVEKIESLKLALSQWVLAGDLDAQAQTLMLIGDAYRSANDPANAIASYESAVQAWTTKNDIRGIAYSKMRLASLARASGTLTNALLNYEAARRLFSQAADRQGEADALYGQAFSHMLMSEAFQAIELLKSALKIRAQLGDEAGEVRASNMLADAYRLVGELNIASDLYVEATDKVANLGDQGLKAAVMNGKALVDDDRSNWESAKKDYLSVLDIYGSLLAPSGLSACNNQPSPDNRGTCRAAARVLVNLGEVYNSLGQPDKALVEINNSVQIANALAEPPAQGESELHLGYTYFLLGDNSAAMDHYRRALSFEEQANAPPKIAQTLVYMGVAEVAQAQPKLALTHYEQALPVIQKTGDKRLLAIAFDKLAKCYQVLGKPGDASTNYAKALEVWRQIKDVDGEALTLNNMADAEAQSGNLTTAIQHSEAAIKIVESLRTRITNEKFRVSYFSDKTNYYELDVDLKMRLSHASSDNRWTLAALQASEMARARALLDTLNDAVSRAGSDAAHANPELARLFKKRNDLTDRLRAKVAARTQLLSGDSKAAIAILDKDIAELLEQLGGIDAEIKIKHPHLDELTTPRVATTSEIQAQLDSDTVLLQFALGEKRSYAWAITTDNVYGYELSSRNEIEAAVTRFMNALLEEGRNDAKESFLERQRRVDAAAKERNEAATHLRKLVLDRVASHLNFKRLVIVADGSLQRVPFSVLPDPNAVAVASDDSPVLLQQHEIVTLPSASVLASQRLKLSKRPVGGVSIAVLADPVFDLDDDRIAALKTTGQPPGRRLAKATTGPGSSPSAQPAASNSNTDGFGNALRDVGLDPNRLGRLRRSRDEALSISNIVPSRQSLTLLGFDANRDKVTSGALSGFRYVHLATHGIVDLEHPELSGIVFSRFNKEGQPQYGYLRFYEIPDLTLAADLVVLSACQTGVGKDVRGEGLLALTRGFMAAGAASVVASLWKVDDNATAELMKRFYQEMFINHKKPSAALRDAQLSLAKTTRWKSPYFWAGFVLQGEWR